MCEIFKMLGGFVVQNYLICLNKCVNKCFRLQKFIWLVFFQIIWINIYVYEIILFIILDEKEKFEFIVFRDIFVQGFNEVGDDFEVVVKFLDFIGLRLDYRRYVDIFFDILVVGSMFGKLYGLVFFYSVYEF